MTKLIETKIEQEIDKLAKILKRRNFVQLADDWDKKVFSNRARTFLIIIEGREEDFID